MGDTRPALQNASFRWLIIGFVIIIIAFGAAGALNMYMLTFFWNFGATGIVIVLIAGPVGSMFGYAAARGFYTALDKKQGVITGTALWLAAHGVSVPLFLGGWLPPPGSTGLLLAVTGFTMLGAFSFTNKSSAAMGSLIGGTVLDLIAWPTGAAVRTAADVPWDTLVSLGLVWGPLSALLAVPGLWCINRYRLNRERHREILRELARKREHAGEAAREPERASAAERPAAGNAPAGTAAPGAPAAGS